MLTRRHWLLYPRRGSPYACFASIGITPDSTMKEMAAINRKQPIKTSEEREAWDELRKKSRRLLLDCFLCEVDLPLASSTVPRIESRPPAPAPDAPTAPPVAEPRAGAGQPGGAEPLPPASLLDTLPGLVEDLLTHPIDVPPFDP